MVNRRNQMLTRSPCPDFFEPKYSSQAGEEKISGCRDGDWGSNHQILTRCPGASSDRPDPCHGFSQLYRPQIIVCIDLEWNRYLCDEKSSALHVVRIQNWEQGRGCIERLGFRGEIESVTRNIFGVTETQDIKCVIYPIDVNRCRLSQARVNNMRTRRIVC